nr:molybdopterin dinucleotide binding domain-containing protein [Eggerthella sinensis]
MYFDNPAFREKDPAPVAEVSPATAQRLGLAEGDAVVLANDRGEARFVLKTAAMRDDLVSVDYGWWHPEWPPGAPAYGGIEESNANCLTSCAVEEPMIGTWSYNALDCTIAKADEAPSWNRYRREGAIRA